MGLTSGLGTMLGPVIGGALAFVSVVFPMYVAVALALLAFVLIATRLREPVRSSALAQQQAKKLRWQDRRVLPFLIMFFCFWMFFTLNQITIAFYLDKVIGIHGSENIARATASALFAMALWAVLMQAVVIQKLKVGAGTLLRVGCPAFVVGFACLLLADSMLLVWVAFSLFGVAMAVGNAGIAGGASLSVEPHEQGAVSGLLAAAPILGMVLGPLIGPSLFEQLSPQAPAAVGLIAFALLSLYALRIKVPER